MTFEYRPPIHIAMYADGTLEHMGEYAWETFLGVPSVGDTLMNAGDLVLTSPMRVVARHFICKDEKESGWWWLVVEESHDRSVLNLDRYIRREYDKIQAERRAEQYAEFLAKQPPRWRKRR